MMGYAIAETLRNFLWKQFRLYDYSGKGTQIQDLLFVHRGIVQSPYSQTS
jgi:hypothetical protein